MDRPHQRVSRQAVRAAIGFWRLRTDSYKSTTPLEGKPKPKPTGADKMVYEEFRVAQSGMDGCKQVFLDDLPMCIQWSPLPSTR